MTTQRKALRYRNPTREVYYGDACLVSAICGLGWSKFATAAPGALDAHRHEAAHEICYIVHGQVEWWAENTIYTVGAGEVFVTFPGERHGGVGGVMHPCELYWVEVKIPPALLIPEGAPVSMSAYERPFSPRVFAGPARILASFERLIEEHRRATDYARALTHAVLVALLIDVLRCQQAADTPGTERSLSPEIQSALAWMERHITDAYPIDTLAQHVNMSVSYFHRRFVEEVGFTPGDYRARLRVEKAKQMLAAEDVPVTELAHQLGFSTSQYFATVFKKLTGMSPTDYAREVTQHPANF